MLRRLILVFPLLLAVSRAGEAPGRRAFFVEPDRKTRTEIRRLVSNKGESIGARSRAERRRARARLEEIGPWSVGALGEALVSGSADERVRMNAAIALAYIEDVRGLVPLRSAARSDRSAPVRLTACLGLGRYARRADAGLLGDVFARPRDRAAPAAALALARLPHVAGQSGDPGAMLFAALADLDRVPPPLAAATVLAAGIQNPDVDALALLGHREELVRQAAAIVLVLRPLPPRRVEELLAVARKRDRSARVRALEMHALGATARTGAVRDFLLGVAVSSREKREVRRAALLALADERGLTAHYKPLRRAYRGLRRNDPLAGPFLLALARTGLPEALDELVRIVRRGEGVHPFYAAGSLAYEYCTVTRGAADARVVSRLHEIVKAASGTRDPRLRELRDAIYGLELFADPREREAKSREVLAGQDPLWGLTRERRPWILANDFLPTIFDLDDLPDRGDPQSKQPDSALDPPGGNGVGGGGDLRGGAGGKSAEGRPEEQDLLDFLSQSPYFVPEDLRGRA